MKAFWYFEERNIFQIDRKGRNFNRLILRLVEIEKDEIAWVEIAQDEVTCTRK